MTADGTSNPVFSVLTMAFLEDTGWYEVDYEYAERFLWGWEEGCDFLYDDCYDSDGEANFPQFCVPPDDINDVDFGCSEDYIATGYCYTINGAIDAEVWDYHNGLVSSDYYADNCHVYWYNTENICTNTDNYHDTY